MTSLQSMPIAPAQPATWNLERAWRPATLARILLVEDDDDLRNGMQVWLRHQGFEVAAVGDGAAGLRAIDEFEPDVVVLDLGLPRMHGFKVLHQLRHRAVAAPHTIVLTAVAGDGARQRALQSGADVVLTKPAVPSALLSTIDELLQGN